MNPPFSLVNITMKMWFVILGVIGLPALYLNYQVDRNREITNDRLNRVENKVLELQKSIQQINLRLFK